ncbi:MAG TPA: HEAT repeat domain-containing protein [Thermoanaerobaculia bacterium]
MPLLLSESLDPARRELTHEHIEGCAECQAEWAAYKETWALLDELPEVEVPPRVKAKFMTSIGLAEPATVAPAAAANVVPFRRRAAAKWLAQAAAIVVIAGGSFLYGNRTKHIEVQSQPTLVSSPIQVTPISIAENRFLAAKSVSPNIEGNPDIQNVEFTDADPSDGKIAMSFDIKSRWTVEGSPSDRSMVRLLSYVLQNEESIASSRSGAIEWVRKTYSDPAYADPEIANALGKVLQNDDHQGVRIRAIDTIKTLPPAVTADTREALIQALKSDPNPAVRLKAVEALAKMAQSGAALDTHALDTLRATASQENENLYVRVKAAEALSNIKP